MPEMCAVCDGNNLTFAFGFSTNARLKKQTEELLQQAVVEYEKTGEGQR